MRENAKIEIFELNKDLGRVILHESIKEIIQRAKAASGLQPLLGPSTRFAIYSEDDTKWYILDLEDGKFAGFNIGEASIAFERILTYSSDQTAGQSQSLRDALRDAIGK